MYYLSWLHNYVIHNTLCLCITNPHSKRKKRTHISSLVVTWGKSYFFYNFKRNCTSSLLIICPHYCLPQGQQGERGSAGLPGLKGEQVDTWQPVSPEMITYSKNNWFFPVWFIVWSFLQGPPGTPGYPGTMGPPGLPASCCLIIKNMTASCQFSDRFHKHKRPHWLTAPFFFLCLSGIEGWAWKPRKCWSERRIGKSLHSHGDKNIYKRKILEVHVVATCYLTFAFILKGPPGNPGYQGKDGSPVSVSS